jgi:hypothetical protein
MDGAGGGVLGDGHCAEAFEVGEAVGAIAAHAGEEDADERAWERGGGDRLHGDVDGRADVVDGRSRDEVEAAVAEDAAVDIAGGDEDVGFAEEIAVADEEDGVGGDGVEGAAEGFVDEPGHVLHHEDAGPEGGEEGEDAGDGAGATGGGAEDDERGRMGAVGGRNHGVRNWWAFSAIWDRP